MTIRSETVADGDQTAHAQYNTLRQDALFSHYPAGCWTNQSGAVSVSHGDMDAWELSNGANESVRLTGYFKAAPVTVKVLVIAEETNDIEYQVTTDFGASGEAYNLHSDSIGATAQGLNQNTLEAIDITAAFTGVAAGDFFGLVFQRNGGAAADSITTPVNVIGLQVDY